MINKTKTALGIDISNNCLNMALLKSHQGNIELVKSVQVQLPEGTIHNGSVADPIALARVIKQTKSANKMSSRNAAISLCAEPTLLQILALPKSSPANLRKYIQDEVRQYAILPLKNIDMDFCGLKPSFDSSHRPVLVSAAQIDGITLTVRDIEKEKINIRQIEPALLGCIRSCYNKVVTANRTQNCLLVLVKDNAISLCVLKNQNIEFLRTKKLDNNTPSHAELLEVVTEELHSVMQYYELEMENASPKWKILITDSNNTHDTAALIADLQRPFANEDTDITELTKDQLDVEINTEIQDAPSAVAVGLAIKLLTPEIMPFGLNLLPKEILDMHKAKKEILIIANIAAVILLLIFMRIGSLSKKTVRTDHTLSQKKQLHTEDALGQLLSERTAINKEIAEVELNLKAMEAATGSSEFINWSTVLAELASKVPNTIRINNISSQHNEPLQIEGIAVSHKSVNGFVKSLSSCNSILSATLTGTNQDVMAQGPVDYSINCELKEQGL